MAPIQRIVSQKRRAGRSLLLQDATTLLESMLRKPACVKGRNFSQQIDGWRAQPQTLDEASGVSVCAPRRHTYGNPKTPRFMTAKLLHVPTVAIPGSGLPLAIRSTINTVLKTTGTASANSAATRPGARTQGIWARAGRAGCSRSGGIGEASVADVLEVAREPARQPARR